MPLIDVLSINTYTKVVTWEVSEKENVLLDYLKLKYCRIQKYNLLSKKKKREYLGLRSCLKVLGLDNDDILHQSDGSPYITSNYYISISHSHIMVSLGISNNRIGIDIEKNQPNKIFNIKNKFISLSENFYSKYFNESDYLHIIWGIKESLFKFNCRNIWNFLNHYKVDYFNIKNNTLPISCWILTESQIQKYYAFYKKINDYFLVYVIDYVP